MNKQWARIEKIFGNSKFAVVLILIFAVCMMAGTILESYCGSDFAGRALYKSWPFMLLQGLMYLSIAIATLMRLPAKKRLYGFYTIHLGLMTIGAGSLITYMAGVDGQIVLYPLTPTREISLSKDVLTITRPNTKQKITYFLPPVAFTKNINDQVSDIKIKDYLPFAENQTVWQSPISKNQSSSLLMNSAEYRLWNKQVAENFILSTHPEARDFQSTISMGPLTIHYLPSALANCFDPSMASKNLSGIIIWNAKNGDCFIPEMRNIEIKTTKSHSRFLVYINETAEQNNTRLLTFFPDISPWPLKITNNQFQTLEGSPFRAFSKKIFSGTPQLLIFGTSVAFQNKDEKKTWAMKDFKNGPIDLPWMGFKIALEKFETDLIPLRIPSYALPIQKNSELIVGATRAVKVEVEGKDFWATNQSTLVVQTQNEEISFDLKKETVSLPFEFVLEQFKMDKDPGTDNPASFESFVKLFDAKENLTHHIYMNNPLKYQGLTFYQASYFQTEDGQFASILSANIDQGRPFKYIGAILLVSGAIWHFFLRRKNQI